MRRTISPNRAKACGSYETVTPSMAPPATPAAGKSARPTACGKSLLLMTEKPWLITHRGDELGQACCGWAGWTIGYCLRDCC
jgi:hypothetical protein